MSAQRFINLKHDESFLCMAVHPIYPLLAVCDSMQDLYLYHINASQPLMRLMYLNSPADCIAFHSTLPFVAAVCHERGEVTFWNIEKMLNEPDVALNFDLDPTLDPFATVTMVKPSYIIFHPTRPYVAVGGVDSESSFIKIFVVNDNDEPVEVNSIEIPMDVDDPYDKIESITFSSDGVFLAATFGKHIMVWVFSQTETDKMKVLMDVDMNMVVKSIVFSPIDHILVAGCDDRDSRGIIASFKIEKDTHTTPDGWTMTRFPKDKSTPSAISTLAFYPTRPFLVGGFINGDVNFYEVNETDPLSVVNYYFEKPIKPISFNNSHLPLPIVAANRHFLVTCGSNQLHVHALGKKFEDEMAKREASFATKDMPILFTKIMQFEEQKNIIMKAVREVFEGFSIDETGDYLKLRCEIKRAKENCLTLEFMKHDFYKDHFGDDVDDVDMDFDPSYEGFDVLYIRGLSKCGTNSGNSLLALLDKLANSIPFIEYIALFDASGLMRCDKDVTLYQLKILASETGDSWYGSKGYKSQTHDKVMEHNMKLRNQIMNELLEVVDPNVKSNIMNAFPELDPAKTVHECFKMMSEQIRSFPEKKCTVEQNIKLAALKNLMSAMEQQSSFKLESNQDLLKRVSHGGYKRAAKKRATKKRAAKKSATKKRAAKKSATKKRATKKRATKKRAAKKRRNKSN